MRFRGFAHAIVFAVVALSLSATSAGLSSGCASVKVKPTLSEQEQARQIGAKIANGIKNTATVLRTLQDAEIELHNAPADRRTISDAEHRKIQSAFLIVFQQLDNSLTRLAAVTKTADLSTTVVEVQKALSDLSDALVVANPQAAKYLKAAAEGVRLVFAVVEALLSSLPMLPVSETTVQIMGLYVDEAFLLERLATRSSFAALTEGAR